MIAERAQAPRCAPANVSRRCRRTSAASYRDRLTLVGQPLGKAPHRKASGTKPIRFVERTTERSAGAQLQLPEDDRGMNPFGANGQVLRQ